MSRPFRYTFILLLAALSTALAAVGGWRFARASAPINGPIILISVDSLRADHLPVYGYQQLKTPGIDRLAEDGVVFDRAFSHVPQSLPANAALLTGRLPFDIGVRDSVGFTIQQSERLLPEMLRDRGYSTAAIISSFLLRKDTGINQGFALFDATFSTTDESGSIIRRDPLDAEKAAEKWLTGVGSQRGFLFLHLDGPHPPYPSVRDSESSSYDSTVMAVDGAVDRLIRYLKSHQLYDQSALILIGSHGEGLGDHGETAHGLLTYQEGLRIPLIIKPPAGEGARRRVKIAVQQVDIVPTILNLAKAPLPGNLRGRSLTPLLDRDGIIPNQLIYSESLYGFYHFGWNELTSLTDGRYHYIRGVREELYDLETDPTETRSIAEEQPQTLLTFQNGMKKFSPPVTLRKIESVSADDRERYELFGYVGSRSDLAENPSTPVNPADKVEVVERYRKAVELLDDGDIKAAIDQLRALTSREPQLRDVWMLLANTAWRADRPDIALDAYQHASELEPANPDAQLGAAAAALRLHRLDDAAARAQHVIDLSAVALAKPDLSAEALAKASNRRRAVARAHELLAEIALARHNNELAHSEAALAEEIDAGRPVTAYVDGRIAFDRRRWAEALEQFEPALDKVEKDPRSPLADLRLLTAEALVRQDRLPEAEYFFLEELKQSPLSERARAGLISVYKATGRAAEAAALTQR